MRAVDRGRLSRIRPPVLGADLAEQVRDGAVAVDDALAAVGVEELPHGFGAGLVTEGEALGELAEEVPALVRVVTREDVADGVVDGLDGVAVVEVRGRVGVHQQMPVLLQSTASSRDIHWRWTSWRRSMSGLLAAVEQPGGLEGGGAGAGVDRGVAEALGAEQQQFVVAHQGLAVAAGGRGLGGQPHHEVDDADAVRARGR